MSKLDEFLKLSKARKELDGYTPTIQLGDNPVQYFYDDGRRTQVHDLSSDLRRLTGEAMGEVRYSGSEIAYAASRHIARFVVGVIRDYIDRKIAVAAKEAEIEARECLDIISKKA